LLLLWSHSQPASPTTTCRLQQKGIAYFLCHLPRLVGIQQHILGAGYDRQARLAHQLASFHLVGHRADSLGRGADEGYANFLADFRDIRVLGEEAVPRVDRIAAGHFGGTDDRGDMQVRAAGSSWAYADSRVRQAQGQAVSVSLRI